MAHQAASKNIEKYVNINNNHRNNENNNEYQ